MNATTTTPTVALSVAEWAEIWGYSEAVALELLQTMRDNVVVEDAHGRWSLTVPFVTEFERAFAAFEVDDDADETEDEADPGGYLAIENRMASLPRPAQFRRGS